MRALPRASAAIGNHHFPGIRVTSFHWLRNGHVRPRLDAALKMIGEPFRSGICAVYPCELGRNGEIYREIIPGDLCHIRMTVDCQFCTVADASIAGEMSPTIIFRDCVQSLGTRYGGKHGGQPLAGNPLKWRNAQDTVEEGNLAQRFSKRRDYRHGLAVDIEIAGTGESTANADIESVQRFGSRRTI